MMIFIYGSHHRFNDHIRKMLITSFLLVTGHWFTIFLIKSVFIFICHFFVNVVAVVVFIVIEHSVIGYFCLFVGFFFFIFSFDFDFHQIIKSGFCFLLASHHWFFIHITYTLNWHWTAEPIRAKCTYSVIFIQTSDNRSYSWSMCSHLIRSMMRGASHSNNRAHSRCLFIRAEYLFMNLFRSVVNEMKWKTVFTIREMTDYLQQ